MSISIIRTIETFVFKWKLKNQNLQELTKWRIPKAHCLLAITRTIRNHIIEVKDQNFQYLKKEKTRNLKFLLHYPKDKELRVQVEAEGIGTIEKLEKKYP